MKLMSFLKETQNDVLTLELGDKQSIEWFVDGKLVHQEDGSDGPLPVTPGKIILNHWGTVGAAPWSSEYEASATPSVMTISRVSFTSASVLAARTYPAGWIPK